MQVLQIQMITVMWIFRMVNCLLLMVEMIMMRDLPNLIEKNVALLFLKLAWHCAKPVQLWGKHYIVFLLTFVVMVLTETFQTFCVLQID